MAAGTQAIRRTLGVAMGFVLVGLPVSADLIRLRGGGTMQGVVEPDPQREGYARVWTASSSSPLSIRLDRILSVEATDSALNDYVGYRKGLAETAEAHLELADWCERVGLTGLAQFHYRETVRLDPANRLANEKLGRVLVGDRWMTQDEAREAHGLVKWNGRWVTPEEKARAEQAERQSASQRAWARLIGQLADQWASGDDRQASEVERKLREINDPEAIVPLVNTLGHRPSGLRTLLAELLGAMTDPRASQGLVHRYLAEDNDGIRVYTLGFLLRRQDPVIRPALIDALEASKPIRAGRAATALAALQAEEAVPRLVTALVSVQKRVEVVMMPAPSGGGAGMGFSAGISRLRSVSSFNPLGLQNGQATTSSSGAIVGPANGAGAFATGYSVPVLTGPVTAPGVVAFGATALPLYDGVGFSTGNGGAPGFVPTPVEVPYEHRNREVLAALIRLSGRDFGFDVAAWKRWLRTEYRAPEGEQPGRRVPQP